MLPLPPTEVLASWPYPNYVNPVTRGPELRVVGTLSFSIATASLLVRLYTRIFTRRWFGPDDGFLLFAWICALGVSIAVTVGEMKFDWNRHVWDVYFGKISGSFKVMYVSRVLWGLSTSSVRLSILCFYYRLLGRCNGPTHFFWVLHVVTASQVGLLLLYAITGFFPCVPIRAYWTWPPMENRYCVQECAVILTSAGLNIVSELIMAILPVIAVFRLRVHPHQRWSVVGLLSQGFLVAIAGCFRTYYIIKLFGPSDDYTWWSTPHWICSEVEIYIAITCACAATLRPVIGRLVSYLKGLPEDTSNGLRKVWQERSGAVLASGESEEFANVSKKYESHAQWNTVMSRTVVDLEGLRFDGFGYTVTIMGPPKKQKTRMRTRASEFLTLKTSASYTDSAQSSNGVVTSKTFEVCHEDASRHGKTSSDCSITK